jgi:signal transduction histidine kinase
MAVFTVSDSGTGIALKDLPNIFKMFYTTHSGKRTQGGA